MTTELFDEAQTTAIHLYQAWQLSFAEAIGGYLAAEDFNLEQTESLNRYSTLLSFSKFQLPVWVQLTNQTQIDIDRFAADGFGQTHYSAALSGHLAQVSGSYKRTAL